MAEQKAPLYIHVRHPHVPRNINRVRAAEQSVASLNQKVAILLTKAVGTMVCAYLFALIALIGFPNLLAPVVAQYVQWVSQTFIQLFMLSVIMVGQSLLGHHAELLADEQYQTTMKSYQDIEQIITHLDIQDTKILEILTHLEMQQHSILKQNTLMATIEHRLTEQTSYYRDWR